MSAQGKQPPAARKALPSVVRLHHARPRLRSPGLRIDKNTASPERAQQMGTGQTPSRKPEQSTWVTNAEQHGNAPLFVPRCASRRETATLLRGDCRALSGLITLMGRVTQGDVIARGARDDVWADMFCPFGAVLALAEAEFVAVCACHTVCCPAGQRLCHRVNCQ